MKLSFEDIESGVSGEVEDGAYWCLCCVSYGTFDLAAKPKTGVVINMSVNWRLSSTSPHTLEACSCAAMIRTRLAPSIAVGSSISPSMARRLGLRTRNLDMRPDMTLVDRNSPVFKGSAVGIGFRAGVGVDLDFESSCKV